MLYYLEQWHERGTSCIRINVEWRDRNSFSHQCGRYFRDSGGLLWRLDMSASVKKSIWQTPAEGNWITSVVTTLTCGCGGTKRKKVKKNVVKKLKSQHNLNFPISKQQESCVSLQPHLCLDHCGSTEDSLIMGLLSTLVCLYGCAQRKMNEILYSWR